MDNIIVASFKDEKSAVEGLDRLNAPANHDNVIVYSQVLLRKTSDEYYEFLEKKPEANGWRAVGGSGLGGLIGLFGGPSGVVIGMIVGAAVGTIADAGRYSFDEAFIDKVTGEAPVGTTSIIAEVGESDVAFVNRELDPLGAQVWRSGIYAERRRLVRSRLETLKSQIKETEEAVRQSRADDIAAVKDALVDLRNKHEARIADIKATIQEEMADDKASLNVLHGELTRKVDKAKMHRLHRRIAKYQDKISRDEAELQRLSSEVDKIDRAGAA